MRQLFVTATLIIGVSAILCVAGCVKMDQDVTLKADGSSVVKIHYAMREEHVAQMQAMQGMGAPGAPGTPNPAHMEAMLKQLEEMQKRAGTTPGGAPAMPFDMKELAKQMEAMRGGAQPPTGDTGLPGTTTAPKPKPEKSIKEQIEDMKKEGRKNPDLKIEKPATVAGQEDFRKQIEDMKKAARKEAAVGKGEQLKPEVPKIEKPTKLIRPPSGLPSAGNAGFGGLLFDEKEIRKQFAAREKDGVVLKDVRVVTKDGWRHAYITSTCKDLSTATSAPTGGGKGGNMGLTRDAADNYVLVIANPQLGKMSGSGSSAEEMKAEHDQARKSMPGFKMTMNLTVPGNIVKTNAHKTSGRTVNWVLDIEDEKFPQKCKALEREGMKVVFEGKGLKLKTFKPTVVK